MSLLYYQVLELEPGATSEEIRKAYRRMAKIWHPDINPSSIAHQRFQQIQQAYEYLISGGASYWQRDAPPVSSDPYAHYYDWIDKIKQKEAEETRRKYYEFIKKRDALQNSKFYYPMLLGFYVLAIVVLMIMVIVMGMLCYTILKTHIIMFFVLLPLISGCIAALKMTIDHFREFIRYFH